MSDQLLTILQVCLLALLYLFFVRVLRAVWTEVSSGAEPASVPGGGVEFGGDDNASGRRGNKTKTRRKTPSKLKVLEPQTLAGATYDLGVSTTIGRGVAADITIEDSYLSSIHARLALAEGDMYAEDLGSTNGTFVHNERLSGPVLLKRGDQLRVGNIVFEAS